VILFPNTGLLAELRPLFLYWLCSTSRLCLIGATPVRGEAPISLARVIRNHVQVPKFLALFPPPVISCSILSLRTKSYLGSHKLILRSLIVDGLNENEFVAGESNDQERLRLCLSPK